MVQSIVYQQGTSFYTITAFCLLIVALLVYVIYYVINKNRINKISYWYVLGIILIIIFVIAIINYIL